tara:strand:+ start:263 stop:451 length:189 start_codon:yes stop_codon:yes gene_type:complete
MNIKVTKTNLVIIEKNNNIKVYTLKEYIKLKRDNKIINQINRAFKYITISLIGAMLYNIIKQ